MNKPNIVNAMAFIDEDLITDSIEYKNSKRINLFWKLGTIAACIAVIVVSCLFIIPTFFNEKDKPIIQEINKTDDSSSLEIGNSDIVEGWLPENNEPIAPVDKLDFYGRYKELSISETVSPIIQWPWDSKTLYEKYTSLTLDGRSYNSQGREVSDTWIGDFLGVYDVNGYDHTNNMQYNIEAEVYTIQHILHDNFLAVKLEDKYYVFKNNEYAPPKNLGEFLYKINLNEVVELNRFSADNNSVNSTYYVLNDDSYIWDVLSNCKEASFIEDMFWFPHEREYLSFTVTSEPLGVYKVAMYITEDGYLWTNALGWQYLFEIGVDAAQNIIAYAKENSSQAEYEPYRNSIAGRIVEITDEYMLIDDSELCVDTTAGIFIKVLLDDLRIKRYVSAGKVAVGDVVQVSFEGEVDIENGFIIDSAVYVSSAIVYNGDVVILE